MEPLVERLIEHYGLQPLPVEGTLFAGHLVQYIIPAGTWQAGELHPDGTYGLFGCTMAPGFTGSGFVAATRTELLAGHPDRAIDIERLTVADGHATTMPDGFAT